MYKKIFLKKENLKHSLHPWIFSGALKQKYDYDKGEIVDLYFNNEFISRGYYNNTTSIAYRVLTYKKNEIINKEFFKKRFKEAENQISKIIDKTETDSYRLIFGENSYIPGLIIDKYDDHFVIQLHTAGIDNLKEEIKEAIKEIYAPKAIINKSALKSRAQEGLKPIEEVLYGLPQKKIIKENNIFFEIDFENSQKTGTFLDQRENRKTLTKYFKKGKLLNMFGYNGGFNLYLKNCSCESINWDISENALKQYVNNLKLNNMDLNKHIFLKSDIFKAISNNHKFEQRFDAIVLDPPALAKNLKNKKRAVGQYIKLNEFALNNLKEGGFLFSSSCTNVVNQNDFEFALQRAAQNTKSKITILEKKFNSPDHPMNPHFPEGIYLKFYVIYKY